jgi:hypothetical protein
VTRPYLIALVLVIGAAVCHAAAWDFVYDGSSLPAPPINATSELTHFSPDDTREVFNDDALHIVDSAINRSRYRVDLDLLYGSQVEAGTVETRQRFAASSDMNNIAVMMRQDTPGASAEMRVGYCDAGGGLRGLWNARTGEFLGTIDPAQYYKLRMVLDDASGGRLYVNDSYYARLAAAPGGSSRLAFGAFSTLGTGETYIDYFRWCHTAKAGPGEPDDPADPAELISPRILALPVAAPAADSVTITWSTDAAADSTVHWGSDWACGSSATDQSLSPNHSVTITGLQPGATYRYYVESRVPSDSDVAQCSVQSFTTQDDFRIDSGPLVKTTTDGKSATISWTTTFKSDAKLFFRPSGATTWTERYSAAKSTSHAMAADNLTPNSAYEYCVLSTRAGEPDAQSSEASFYTYVYSGTGSLLVNGDFELGNTAGWTTAPGSDPGSTHQGPWMGSIMPHSGNYFLGSDSNGGARNGTLYQKVTNLPPGDNIYATAWVHTYETDASGKEEHNSAFCRIGIDVAQDPNGTINPNAASIRWSAPVYTANAGPWTCIGVAAPRSAANHAVVFIKHVQSADGGVNTTCFDDVVLTTSAPANITAGPTVAAMTPTSATIEWTTDASSTSFVQFGSGTLGDYQFSDFFLDPAPKTLHSATIRVNPASTYVFQAGSAAQLGLALSQPATLASPMNEAVENAGFEDTNTHGQATSSPWTIFQYDINQIPRFYMPGGQPAGGPVDGLVGPNPWGGSSWHGVTCETGAGSHFIGAYAANANKNGGAYERIKVTRGQVYKASMRFLTRQDPIDSAHPAGNTACAIAIDPAGGTDVRSSSLIWSSDKTSAVNGQWDEVSVRAAAASDFITVFCVMEQRGTDVTRLTALDSVTLQVSQPVSGTLGELKQQPVGTPVRIPAGILTYASIPAMVGSAAKLYVEEADRSSGIAILSKDPDLWSSQLRAGDKVDADGIITVIGGEAVVSDAILTITPGVPGNTPKPYLLTQHNLGGGPFGIQPGITGGIGLSTTGLLVKIVGTVTSGEEWSSGWITDAAGNTCAYLDDGSGLSAGFGAAGVKVIAPPIVRMYRPIWNGDPVSAVGVSSVESVDGVIRPVVLVWNWSGVEVIPTW